MKWSAKAEIGTNCLAQVPRFKWNGSCDGNLDRPRWFLSEEYIAIHADDTYPAIMEV
jgi:hypothetical protein